MKKRTKVIVAVSVITTLVVMATRADALTFKGKFGLVISTRTLNMTCRPGQTEGTSTLSIRATRRVEGLPGRQVGTTGTRVATRLIAIVQGGRFEIRRFGVSHQVVVTAPCGHNTTIEARLRALRGTRRIGRDAHAKITVNVVATAS